MEESKSNSGILPVSLEVFEDWNKDLTEAKMNRTWIEYLWTLTPLLMMDTLVTTMNLTDEVAYVDADLYFFSSLDGLYEEVFNCDMAVIPHRWTPKYEERLRPNGIYNVSWVWARSTISALGFLDEWRDLCIEWCYNTLSPQGIGDQGYLDKLVPKYSIYAIKHLGANLAPWNQEQYRYWKEGNDIMINGDPLLFYHFHEFQHSTTGAVLRRTGYPLHEAVARNIYPPYEREIREICNDLAKA
jgi:hypothetical protein